MSMTLCSSLPPLASQPSASGQAARSCGPALCQRSNDDYDPLSSIALLDVQSLLQETRAGASDQRISSPAELSALCGTDPTPDGSEAFLFAKPLWGLYWEIACKFISLQLTLFFRGWYWGADCVILGKHEYDLF
jgi:hypothetical protein